MNEWCINLKTKVRETQRAYIMQPKEGDGVHTEDGESRLAKSYLRMQSV